VEGSTVAHQCFGFRHILLAHCQKPAPRGLRALDQFAVSNARFRTRNLALRVSGIERTEAHAMRPSLSDVKRF
jgi:hypothetical protein